jgi:hypothetical protein
MQIKEAPRGKEQGILKVKTSGKPTYVTTILKD